MKIKKSTKFKLGNFKNFSGFSYIEVMFAIGMLVILGTYLLPMFPQALRTIDNLTQRDKLVTAADYVSKYIDRWADFSPLAKTLPFDFYLDGNELELSGDYRINHLQFAEPILTTSNEYLIKDEYKASIKFWETASSNRALVNVKVWYDSNLDNQIGPTENVITFSKILIEKRK